jgi:hypothetical protein
LIQRYIALTFIATCALSTPAYASDDRSLSSVAAADGYSYSWLPTEAGVVLTRPGLRVVLRSGRLFYEVNNATPIADRAPVSTGDDLMISPALAARLGEIAQRASLSSDTAPFHKTVRIASARVPGTPQPVTVATKLVPQRFAIAVSGTGTPNTTLTVTLTGEISRDLPVVTIRRAVATVGANGTYAIEMLYGPDAHQRMLVTATVVSADGTDRAHARIAVDGDPNGVTSTGLDDWPKN